MTDQDPAARRASAGAVAQHGSISWGQRPGVLWVFEQVTGVRMLFFAVMLLVAETAGQAGVPWELIGQAFAANLAQFAAILPLAFCEEWGWHGCLLNRLRERMGTWPALVLIGVIRGVWHRPFCVGPWFSMSGDALRSLLPFTIFWVFFGMLLGWLPSSTPAARSL